MLSTAILLPLFGSAASAANLWAVHYEGTVNYLTFEGTSLAVTTSTKVNNKLPSWITLDHEGKRLYIPDENFYGNGGGTLVAFTIGANGALTPAGTAATPNGVVATSLYGGSDGKGFIANAHYQTSQLTTFKLPLQSGAQPVQTLTYTMNGRGPNPQRQDAPHPHHAFTDPTGDFLIVPDLGADQIRINKIDADSGKLTECPSGTPVGGTGPRHGVFWTPGGGNSSISRVRRQASNPILYIANELSNSVSAWGVTYEAGGCMKLALKQTITPYEGNATATRGTKVGEIHVKDNFLYTSNRVDKKFNGNDSITQYTIGADGTLTWTAITSSHGTYPRTFSINNAGTFVAIGDQTTANVAIVPRDPTTGKLGDLVANLRIGATGVPENEDGLSAVIWAE